MNNLQHETSPYLLQHARNPVDWYAWKPEAFERARAEQKPILVSIGYSACHWCHVMEHESFENEDVAAFMNERFINIKVDREERPDVDAIYMEACQLLTGSGGWPLNCFLTPEGKPFFAGTYYPPRPAHNRPSWLQVLQHLANIWETKRETALEQADKLLDYIRQNDAVFLKKTDTTIGPEQDSPFTTAALDTIFDQMRAQFDHSEGGFGGAPKFPSTMAIRYLLCYHWYTGSHEALEHALLSLNKMIMGGIYDQLGGGFARYATDRAWLVPHFEKMLYDNALLISVISDAYKLLKTPKQAYKTDANQACIALYRETIEETLDFVAREMTHPKGGFYAAQDADSEGVEGKFYVWTKAEIEEILGDDAELFCNFYDVTETGNWEHTNILWRPVAIESFADSHQLSLNALKKQLNTNREKLYQVRAKRIPPRLDDKILLGWNALMCSAFVKAYTALGNDAYLKIAVRAMDFLLENMTKGKEKRFYHTWKDDRVQYQAVLDDYAFAITALLDIWQITFNSMYLTAAEKYTEQVLSYFHDQDSGLFFFTASDQTDIVLRKKDLYDNATPSGNSTMVHVLQRLGILLDRQEWREMAVKILRSMQATVARHPLSFEHWAAAIMNETHPCLEIAVIGDDAFDKIRTLQNRFLPNMVAAASTEEVETSPLLAGKPGATDAYIYICQNYTCQKPVQSLADFDQLVEPNK